MMGTPPYFRIIILDQVVVQIIRDQTKQQVEHIQIQNYGLEYFTSYLEQLNMLL